MTGDPLLRRGDLVLRADPSRVITKLFLPGKEMYTHGISRANAVIRRVLAMTDEDVSTTLASTVRRFADRHHDLRTTFAEHFAAVAHQVPQAADTSAERRDLIGAYCTQEYAIEAAALFNPSIVVHPDQTGVPAGELRFVMSVRAVGEGHLSSIEFRTGVVTASDGVRLDDPDRHLVTGRATPATISRDFLRAALAERTEAAVADDVLSRLPAQFDGAELDAVLATVKSATPDQASTDATIGQIRWIAACNYRVRFPPDCLLSERVLYPSGPDESHGLEDARFTRFVDEQGKATFYATYTAYDGSRVAPHLLQTDDFETFDSAQLVGPAAKNKGMALFPRRVNGQYLALSRWDRESIDIASSADIRWWDDAVTVHFPQQPWELIQLGNCGSPIETSEGWLVLTHGVGPMREYGIGAILLDIDDPTTTIGVLDEPLLTPNDEEREGYVPNVVYTCGALLHGETLVMPYGCSDSSIRFAYVDLPELLNRLRAADRHRVKASASV